MIVCFRDSPDLSILPVCKKQRLRRVCTYAQSAQILPICNYGETCLKWPLKNRQNKSRQVVASCRLKVMQNAPEHSAILLTCIKRLSVLKAYFGSSFE